jgi:hypothetical protein
MAIKTPAARFPLGRIVATPAALEHFATDQAALHALLGRHRAGDWGDVDRYDARENEFSVANGFRILSAYRAPDGEKVWVITEADRSATTILLPSDY